MKSFSVIIKKKINKFNKTIFVDGDKSISHRALLISSLAYGISKLEGLLESEDILNTIAALKKLGVKIYKYKNTYQIYGNGLGSFKTRDNIKINAGNSGTLARMLMGLLANYPHKIKIFLSLNIDDIVFSKFFNSNSASNKFKHILSVVS